MEDVFQGEIDTAFGALELSSQADALADDLIFVVDRQFSIQYLNMTLEIPLSFQTKEGVASRPDILFSRQFLELLRPKLRTVFKTGDRAANEGKVVVGDREVWLDTRLTPIKDEKGRVKSVLGISREITEHKRQEQLLSRSRREWLRVVDTLPYVMASADIHYRVQKVNAAMARKLGVTVQEAVGLACYKHICGLKAPPPSCPLLQTVHGGEAHGADSTEKEEPGEWCITVRPIKDPDGKVVGCLYVGRDASDSDSHEAVSTARKNRQVMKRFLRHADHSVVIQDREGKYLFLNSVPGNRSSPADLVGKTPVDFFEPAEASRMVERVRSVAVTGLDMSGEREVTLDGEVFTFFERISPILDSLGNIEKVVTVSQKISANLSTAAHTSNPESGAKALSGREREVLRLIALGLTNSRIADKLFISKKTVETHRARIMQKLAINKASALVRYAIESGLI